MYKATFTAFIVFWIFILWITLSIVLSGAAQAGVWGTCWSYAKIAAIDEDRNCALSLDEFQAFILYDFVDVDADEDLVITNDELDRFCKRACQKKVFQERDANHDQLIDVEEFLTGSEEKFDQLDLDYNAQISKAELFKNAATILKR